MLNASPDDNEEEEDIGLMDCDFDVGLAAGEEEEEGVIGREFEAEESMEKTSCCCAFLPLFIMMFVVAEPSFGGGGVGLMGAVVFHRSANESAMMLNRIICQLCVCKKQNIYLGDTF